MNDAWITFCNMYEHCDIANYCNIDYIYEKFNITPKENLLNDESDESDKDHFSRIGYEYLIYQTQDNECSKNNLFICNQTYKIIILKNFGYSNNNNIIIPNRCVELYIEDSNDYQNNLIFVNLPLILKKLYISNLIHPLTNLPASLDIVTIYNYTQNVKDLSRFPYGCNNIFSGNIILEKNKHIPLKFNIPLKELIFCIKN